MANNGYRALLSGGVVFLVWTERQNAAHLISCRYADKHQTQRYFTAVQPRANRRRARRRAGSDEPR